MLTRRWFLACAPAVVACASLMPVRSLARLGLDEGWDGLVGNLAWRVIPASRFCPEGIETIPVRALSERQLVKLIGCSSDYGYLNGNTLAYRRQPLGHPGPQHVHVNLAG